MGGTSALPRSALPWPPTSAIRAHLRTPETSKEMPTASIRLDWHEADLDRVKAELRAALNAFDAESTALVRVAQAHMEASNVP